MHLATYGYIGLAANLLNRKWDGYSTVGALLSHFNWIVRIYDSVAYVGVAFGPQCIREWNGKPKIDLSNSNIYHLYVCKVWLFSNGTTYVIAIIGRIIFNPEKQAIASNRIRTALAIGLEAI